MFLIKLCTLKNEVKRAGVNYHLSKSKININKKTVIILIIVFGIMLLSLIIGSFILRHWYFLMLSLFMILNIIIFYIMERKYKNIKGIYENGIIVYFKELFEWKKVHSYSITDNKLIGYLKNGNVFEFNDIENIDEIRCLFETKNIKHR
jgi:hypothetical protein